jgi:hypothetical protein
MRRFALGYALAVAALLMDLPAGAEELKLSRHPELLTPSPNNAEIQFMKLLAGACKKSPLGSPMGAIADLFGEAWTEGKGKVIELGVKLLTKGAEEKFCDALDPKNPKLALESPNPTYGNLSSLNNPVCLTQPFAPGCPLAQNCIMLNTLDRAGSQFDGAPGANCVPLLC